MDPEKRNDMSGDTRQFETLLNRLITDVGELKEFILLHTRKIENIEPLTERVQRLETKIAVMENSYREQPKNRDFFQVIAWLLIFGLLLYQTIFK